MLDTTTRGTLYRETHLGFVTSHRNEVPMDKNDEAACTQCRGTGAQRNKAGCNEDCYRCRGTGHDPDNWKNFKKKRGQNRVSTY